MRMLPTEIAPARPDAPVLVSPDGQVWPLQGVSYKVKVHRGGAQVRVVHTFVNTGETSCEMVYIFPLPVGAHVGKMRAEVGGEVLRAVLKERGSARDEYFEAVQQGRFAALLESERSDVFTLSLGQVQAGQKVVAHISLAMAVDYDEGYASITLPTVVGKRYHSGAVLDRGTVGEGVVDTDRVPDASRLDPPRFGQTIPVSLKLSSEDFLPGLELNTVPCEMTAKAAFETHNLAADRDICLRWVAQVPNSATWVPDGKKGVVEVVWTPQKSTRKPVDVAVLLDRSGSMSGWKMVAARGGAARLIGGLNKHDRVWLGWFDHRMVISSYTEHGLVRADAQARHGLCAELETVAAEGGTELASALRIAGAALGEPEKGRDKVVFLLTDGQVSDYAALARVGEEDLGGVRIIVCAIDSISAQGPLASLGGHVQAVPDPTVLDEVVLRLTRRVLSTAGQNLRLGGAGLSSSVPDRVDGYAGSTVRLYAKVGPGITTVRIHSDDHGLLCELPVKVDSDAGVVNRYATSKVLDLLDRAQPDHEQALKVALRYRVLCPLTAFVATGKNVVGAASPEQLVHVVQPVFGGYQSFGMAGSASVGRATFRGASLQSLAAPAPMMSSSAQMFPSAAVSMSVESTNFLSDMGESMLLDVTMPEGGVADHMPNFATRCADMLTTITQSGGLDAPTRRMLADLLADLRETKRYVEPVATFVGVLDRYDVGAATLEQLCEALLELSANL